MAELELARLHEDGEHLVLRAPDGAEHSLTITEALRAAVRRDRPRAEALQAQAAMRPRDVQARLRAGATVEELAAESGLPEDHLRRYEWPVAAERDHVVAQVRGHRLAGDGEPVTLGEVADTRLVARGVGTDEARWSARRDGNAPWVVEVRFSAGDRDRSARWTYDPKARVVTPLDDEARWLGQPDDPVSPEVLGVPSLGRSGGSRTAADHQQDATALLLDDLADRRGQRAGSRGRRPDGAADAARTSDTSRPADDGTHPRSEPLPLGLVPAPAAASGPSHDDVRASTPPAGDQDRDRDVPLDRPDTEAGASVVDLGSRRAGNRAPEGRTGHPSGSRRPPSPDTPVDDRAVDDRAAGDVADPETPAPSTPPSTGQGPQPSAPPAGKTAGRRPGRKGRAQVPSWDEIVFGGGRPSS